MSLPTLAAMVLFAAGCSQPERQATPQQRGPTPTSAPVDAVSADADDMSKNLKLDWVFVEKKLDPTTEAEISGTFDSKRNKITITTRNVRQFALDTRRVPIDWERLVILRLNGRNSELRKRDQVFYRFTKDRSRGWVVVEK